MCVHTAWPGDVHTLLLLGAGSFVLALLVVRLVTSARGQLGQFKKMFIETSMTGCATDCKA